MIETTPPHHQPTSARAHAPHKVKAVRAFHWLAAGWRLFAGQPWQWVLMALVAFIVMAIASLAIVPWVPIIGPMVAPVLFVTLTGGMLSAAQDQANGETIRFEQLFDGFRRHAGNLSLVGVFYSIPLVLMSLITVLALGGGLIVGLLGTALGGAVNVLLHGTIALLSMLAAGWFVSLIALLLMILALICAPALIMFRDRAPLDAMRLSLQASLLNLRATLLFGLLLFVLGNIAAITVVGVLVFIPVSVGALRQAYLDIFGEAHAMLVSPTVS